MFPCANHIDCLLLMICFVHITVSFPGFCSYPVKAVFPSPEKCSGRPSNAGEYFFIPRNTLNRI